MLVMRTTEDPTDPIRKLISSPQTVGFDDLALGVYPLGLLRKHLLRTSVNKDVGIGVYVPESGVRRCMRMVKVDPSPILLRTSRLPP